MLNDPALPLLAIAALLVLAGLAGTILPAIPGVPLIFAGLCLAAWAQDFRYVGGWTLAFIGVLALTAYAADLVASALGAKKFGASRLAVVGALAGTVVGLFAGIPGLLFGPFIGAAAGELIARRDLLQAGRAGFGTWLGLIVGGAVKIALSISMVALFVVALVL